MDIEEQKKNEKENDDNDLVLEPDEEYGGDGDRMKKLRENLKTCRKEREEYSR